MRIFLLWASETQSVSSSFIENDHYTLIARGIIKENIGSFEPTPGFFGAIVLPLTKRIFFTIPHSMAPPRTDLQLN